MSLQVWLPLDGDLNNQGLLRSFPAPNSQITGNRFTETGKIGDLSLSYTTALSTYTTWFTDTTNNNFISLFEVGKKYSIAGWFKIKSSANTTNNSTTFVQLGYNTENIYPTNSYRAFGLWWTNETSGSGPRFVVNNGDNGGAGSIATSIATDYNVWHHIAYSLDNTTTTTKCVIYIDGIVVANKTFTKTNSNCNDMNVTNANNILVLTPHKFCYNDLRIYDHILSEKEVKEIAKGLVLHYPLNNYSFYGKNLLYGTSKKVYSTTANTANDRDKGIFSGGSGGNGSFSITEEDVPVGIYSYNITNNTSGNRDFQQGRIPFISGQKYTGSWWAKGSGSCYFRSWNRTKGSAVFAKTYTLTNNWQFFSYTFTATAAQETNDCTWHLGVTGKSSIKIAGMKLELGDKPTIYSPAPEDLQLTGQEIYDTSGYENHASTVGTLTLVPNSSIYNFGINMNNTGTNDHIESIKNINLSSDTITVSCWVKTASKATNQVFFTMPNIQFGTLNSLGYVKPTSMAGFTLNNFINNEWNHIVVIKNGTTYQLYINGIAETQNGASNNYLHNVSKLWLLNRSYNNTNAANASISDFRIYVTALSVDDVLELYKTSKIVSGTTITARDLE